MMATYDVSNENCGRESSVYSFPRCLNLTPVQPHSYSLILTDHEELVPSGDLKGTEGVPGSINVQDFKNPNGNWIFIQDKSAQANRNSNLFAFDRGDVSYHWWVLIELIHRMEKWMTYYLVNTIWGPKHFKIWEHDNYGEKSLGMKRQ